MYQVCILLYVADDDHSSRLRYIERLSIMCPRLLFSCTDGRLCTRINELEWIPDAGGSVVLANIWYEDVIVAIDYKMGVVLKVYTLHINSIAHQQLNWAGKWQIHLSTSITN